MRCLHLPQISPVATETAGDMALREWGTLTVTRSSSPLSALASGPHIVLSLNIHLRTDILCTLNRLYRATLSTRIARPTEPLFSNTPNILSCKSFRSSSPTFSTSQDFESQKCERRYWANGLVVVTKMPPTSTKRGLILPGFIELCGVFGLCGSQ
jgi:hypothetical protein